MAKWIMPVIANSNFESICKDGTGYATERITSMYMISSSSMTTSEGNYYYTINNVPSSYGYSTGGIYGFRWYTI